MAGAHDPLDGLGRVTILRLKDDTTTLAREPTELTEAALGYPDGQLDLSIAFPDENGGDVPSRS